MNNTGNEHRTLIEADRMSELQLYLALSSGFDEIAMPDLQ